jgi:hypothetical protein
MMVMRVMVMARNHGMEMSCVRGAMRCKGITEM